MSTRIEKVRLKKLQKNQVIDNSCLQRHVTPALATVPDLLPSSQNKNRKRRTERCLPTNQLGFLVEMGFLISYISFTLCSIPMVICTCCNGSISHFCNSFGGISVQINFLDNKEEKTQ